MELTNFINTNPITQSFVSRNNIITGKNKIKVILLSDCPKTGKTTIFNQIVGRSDTINNSDYDKKSDKKQQIFQCQRKIKQVNNIDIELNVYDIVSSSNMKNQSIQKKIIKYTGPCCFIIVVNQQTYTIKNFLNRLESITSVNKDALFILCQNVSTGVRNPDLAITRLILQQQIKYFQVNGKNGENIQNLIDFISKYHYPSQISSQILSFSNSDRNVNQKNKFNPQYSYFFRFKLKSLVFFQEHKKQMDYLKKKIAKKLQLNDQKSQIYDISICSCGMSRKLSQEYVQPISPPISPKNTKISQKNKKWEQFSQSPGRYMKQFTADVRKSNQFFNSNSKRSPLLFALQKDTNLNLRKKSSNDAQNNDNDLIMDIEQQNDKICQNSNISDNMNLKQNPGIDMRQRHTTQKFDKLKKIDQLIQCFVQDIKKLLSQNKKQLHTIFEKLLAKTQASQQNNTDTDIDIDIDIGVNSSNENILKTKQDRNTNKNIKNNPSRCKQFQPQNQHQHQRQHQQKYQHLNQRQERPQNIQYPNYNNNFNRPSMISVQSQNDGIFKIIAEVTMENLNKFCQQKIRRPIPRNVSLLNINPDDNSTTIFRRKTSIQ